MLAMHLGVNRALVPRLRLGIPRWRTNLWFTSKANFPTSVQYLRFDLLLSPMGTNGRTGRRRKRKKNGNYHRKYGRAIQDCEYIALLKWAKRNGTSFGKLRPAYFPQTGRGLMTCKKLASGDLVISVPEHMLITTKTVEQSEIGKLLIKLQLMSLLSTNQMLCVFILYEKYRGESSFWHPYISTLPRSFNTPAYFNEEELGALPSCMHQQCETQITTVCESYEELKGFLEHSTSILDKKFLDSLTFDEFRWAWFVVNTRSVYKADEVDTLHVGMATRHTENTYALAPVLDLLNHTDIAEVITRIADIVKS